MVTVGQQTLLGRKGRRIVARKCREYRLSGQSCFHFLLQMIWGFLKTMLITFWVLRSLFFLGVFSRGNEVQKEGRMSYADFVWLLISEEDKRNATRFD